MPEIDPAILDKIKVRFPIDKIAKLPLFRECTPRILVVTDGLTFDTAGFGLSDFVDTLKASSISGMTPIVVTAHTGSSSADLTNFTFTTDTFNIRKYDVLFLFGVGSIPALPAAEVDVISRFMQDGGGVFATGDHAELGKALCNEIPRVRHMRYWSPPDVPSASGFDRLSTNLPGSDDVYQFEDQSDALPQRIYPHYYPSSDGVPANSRPHYLLQHPTKKIIEVLPDHPHEGECVVPDDLTTTFELDGSQNAEWPDDDGGDAVTPDLVALSMSGGGGFSTKQPLAPRSFGAIVAYDGHQAHVGRVSVDATWHHFININLISTSAGPGLAGDADAIDRVHTYFSNLAEWLMPQSRRRCLRWLIVRQALELYPVREFVLPPLCNPIDCDPVPDLEGIANLGVELRSTLRRFLTPAAVEALEGDLLELQRPGLAQSLRPKPGGTLVAALARRMMPVELLGQIALGTAAVAMLEALPLGTDLEAESRKLDDGVDSLESLTRDRQQLVFKTLADVIRESGRVVERACDEL